MVHYGPDRQTRDNLPPICPKCGSHRTQIVGRLEDGKTLIVRCNACGSHSTLLPDPSDAAESLGAVPVDIRWSW